MIRMIEEVFAAFDQAKEPIHFCCVSEERRILDGLHPDYQVVDPVMGIVIHAGCFYRIRRNTLTGTPVKPQIIWEDV